MKIIPVSKTNNNPGFNAVNQKYLKWAEKDIKIRGLTSDWLFCLKTDVYCGDISPRDGIDTINAMKKIRGRTNECIEDLLAKFSRLLQK